MKTKKHIPILIIVLMLFIANKTLYGQCFLPKGIITDPDSPINLEKPSKTNTFFDWRTEGYNINSVDINSPTISSPYNQDNNLNVAHFVDNPDRLPEDGWELIKYNLGYNEDGTPTVDPTGFIYLVLYNKYTGILRVFIAGDQIVSYNGAQIKIQFADGITEKYSSALSNASEIFAVEGFEANTAPSVASFTRFNNDSGRWFYADFHIAYDPCTCFYESSMHIQVNLIDEANINLMGDIEGIIVSTDEGGNVTVDEDGFSFKDVTGAIEAGGKAVKSYKSVDNFRQKQEKALKTQNKTALQLEAEGLFEKATKVKELTEFQEALKKSDFLKAGLETIPYIASALELVEFFIGGGKSGPQEVKIMPMSLQANVKLQGTITATYPFSDITFYTPGSKNAATKSDSQYPYYNEILGVFNLLETPKLKYKFTGATEPYDDDPSDPNNVPDLYPSEIFVKMEEELKYVFNQVITNQLPEIHAALHFDFSDHEQVPDFQNNDLIDIGNKMYRTGYIPIDCLSEFTVGFYDHDGHSSIPIPHPFPSKVYIKLLINVPTGENQQNVLIAAQYPMELVEDNTISNTGSLTGISIEDIILENTTVTEDVLTWKSVTIGSNVTIQSGVRIAGSEGVTISPDITISPDVTISTDLTGGCNGYVNPMNNVDIETFCTGSKYTTGRTPVASRSAEVISSNVKNPKTEDTSEDTNDMEESPIKYTSLKIYPNPTSEYLSIQYQLPVTSDVRIAIVDMKGTTRIEKTYSKRSYFNEELPIGYLAEGVYILSMEFQGKHITRKIIISRD